MLWVLMNSSHGFAEEEPPSLELLEFLGNWETQQGEWLDPTQFIEAPDLAKVELETQEKGNE